MSLDIVVRRDPCGPYKHEDVVEPLLGSSTEAGVCLGESILDQDGTGSQTVEYVVMYRPGLRCGLLVEVFDTLSDAWVYGKITSVEHVCSRSDGSSITLKSRLRLLRPTSFFSKSL